MHVLAAVAYYLADQNDWPSFATGLTIYLRQVANSATGSVTCAENLYGMSRWRNLVYCPAATGITRVRLERSSQNYIFISEVEVFRGTCPQSTPAAIPAASISE